MTPKLGNASRSESEGKSRGTVEIPETLSYETLLSRLLPKDKLNTERHIALSDSTQPAGHADLWRRLACLLITLSNTAKTVGRHTTQFFIPDGKYKMQVFALHDQHDGQLLIYTSHVLDAAFAAKILERPTSDDTTTYKLKNSRDLLTIEPLDARTMTPAPYFKDMLGWNRKAIRITLPTSASAEQISAVEAICVLSAQKWKV